MNKLLTEFVVRFSGKTFNEASTAYDYLLEELPKVMDEYARAYCLEVVGEDSKICSCRLINKKYFLCCECGYNFRGQEIRDRIQNS